MKRFSENLHLFLFAIYPLIALRNFNIIYVHLGSIVRSVGISLLCASLVWGLLSLLLKNRAKAGLVTTLAIILFFSYGHAYHQFQASFGVPVRHSTLALSFGALFVVLSVVVLRLKQTQGVSQFLNVTGSALLIFAVVQSASYDIQMYQANAQARADREGFLPAYTTNPTGEKTLPDIYLIILDAHTRSDVLQQKYDLDNSEFIRDLNDLGFYVATCSQSNYMITRYSLTSLMNMDYLQNFTDMQSMPDLKESTVNQTLRSLGYTTVGFENRTGDHLDLDEDIVLSRNKLAIGSVDLTGGPNEFEAELFQTTFLKFFYDIPQLIPGFDPARLEQTEYNEHYLQTLYILDELSRVPEIAGPKFVFAHILVPHTPYIFTPDGKFRMHTDDISGYRDNVRFVEARILPAVQAIIANSAVPPIIILQGDHGPIGNKVAPEDRMSILNAYLVDAQAKAVLYESITPVNSFRVIFDHYFGFEFPLLEDVSYYAKNAAEFTPESIIPNTCNPHPGDAP
jgi:hypothetical protein